MVTVTSVKHSYIACLPFLHASWRLTIICSIISQTNLYSPPSSSSPTDRSLSSSPSSYMHISPPSSLSTRSLLYQIILLVSYTHPPSGSNKVLASHPIPRSQLGQGQLPGADYSSSALSPGQVVAAVGSPQGGCHEGWRRKIK